MVAAEVIERDVVRTLPPPSRSNLTAQAEMPSAQRSTNPGLEELIGTAKREGWPRERFQKRVDALNLSDSNDVSLANRTGRELGRLPQESMTVARPKDFLDPVDVLRESTSFGRRIPTGFEPLDKAIREGLPIGAIVVITGAPGSGKTALATQLGVTAAVRHGAMMFGIFADEGRRRAAVRVGQLLQMNRDRLESQDEGELLTFRAELPAGRVVLPDPDEEANTLERIGEIVRQLNPKQDLVGVGDSIHVLRAAAAEGKATEQARVKATMGAVRDLARSLPVLMIVTSEVNRAAYRRRRTEENTDPLAAAAETRAIEFIADLQIHLEGDPDTGPITARIVKNRLGGKRTSFRLRFDPATASFVHVDPTEATAEDAELQRLRRETLLGDLSGRILEVLRSHGDEAPFSGRKVEELVRAADVKARSADIRAALGRLKGNGLTWSRIRNGDQWSLA